MPEYGRGRRGDRPGPVDGGGTASAPPSEAIVLYTGKHTSRHDGWIWIMPISQLSV